MRLKLHFHCFCFKSSRSRLEDKVGATTIMGSSWKSLLSCLNVFHLDESSIYKKKLDLYESGLARWDCETD